MNIFIAPTGEHNVEREKRLSEHSTATELGSSRLSLQDKGPSPEYPHVTANIGDSLHRVAQEFHSEATSHRPLSTSSIGQVDVFYFFKKKIIIVDVFKNLIVIIITTYFDTF